MNTCNESSIWNILYGNRLSFLEKSVNEFLIDINNKNLLMDLEYSRSLKRNKIEIYKIIIKNIKVNNIEPEDILENEINYLEKKLIKNENGFIDELNIQYDLIEKIKISEEKNRGLEVDTDYIKVKILKEALSNSIDRVDYIKKQRATIEKRINKVIYKKEKLMSYNKFKRRQRNTFNEIVKNNYLIEYNRVVNLINSKNTLNKDITTYYEYLYLITIEMEKIEGDIYG